MKERTFAEFQRLVKESLEEHAQRKGYNRNGADGENLLYEFTAKVGAEPGHTIGEVIYKLVEFLHQPREVLLIKGAGWLYLLWRHLPLVEGRTREQ